eukprot:TRINITY_DN25077_c0_g1_i1.p1 TRINITY_DN25077_c0_g1~~TRINITY_DN25077_c0_g1_i1.p1  ORF type:complete len:659 (+),score=104.56 TRINITY_DN25077_c0_g1_i1:97-1977(+)
MPFGGTTQERTTIRRTPNLRRDLASACKELEQRQLSRRSFTLSGANRTSARASSAGVCGRNQVPSPRSDKSQSTSTLGTRAGASREDNVADTARSQRSSGTFPSGPVSVASGTDNAVGGSVHSAPSDVDCCGGGGCSGGGAKSGVGFAIRAAGRGNSAPCPSGPVSRAVSSSDDAASAWMPLGSRSTATFCRSGSNACSGSAAGTSSSASYTSSGSRALPASWNSGCSSAQSTTCLSLNQDVDGDGPCEVGIGATGCQQSWLVKVTPACGQMQPASDGSAGSSFAAAASAALAGKVNVESGEFPAKVREILWQLEVERLRCATLNLEVQRQIEKSSSLSRQLQAQAPVDASSTVPGAGVGTTASGACGTEALISMNPREVMGCSNGGEITTRGGFGGSAHVGVGGGYGGSVSVGVHGSSTHCYGGGSGAIQLSPRTDGACSSGAKVSNVSIASGNFFQAPAAAVGGGNLFVRSGTAVRSAAVGSPPAQWRSAAPTAPVPCPPPRSASPPCARTPRDPATPQIAATQRSVLVGCSTPDVANAQIASVTQATAAPPPVLNWISSPPRHVVRSRQGWTRDLTYGNRRASLAAGATDGRDASRAPIDVWPPQHQPARESSCCWISTRASI